jgi:hypothetical protein
MQSAGIRTKRAGPGWVLIAPAALNLRQRGWVLGTVMAHKPRRYDAATVGPAFGSALLDSDEAVSVQDLLGHGCG